jgi:Fic family protein
VEELCRGYGSAIDEERVAPILIAATFVLDFLCIHLCIHAFRDGNGRVSRLATSLLLESQGVRVARYVSLERLIEDSKEEYYRVLKLCSQGWHEGKNEIVPWWNYFLGALRAAYKEFQHQIESVGSRPAKSDQVRQAALAQLEPFTLADMAAQLPAASSQLIKKVLAEMKRAGQIRLAGRGRGARWEVVR